MRKRREKKIPSALVMTGAVFLFLFLIVVISAGISISIGYSPRPRPFGWFLFIAGLIVAIYTVDIWARALPGIFGIATLNGLIILINGHALNQPMIPISRLVVALFTIVMTGASVATASLANRGLTNTDRAANLGILSCFVTMMTCLMESLEHWEVPVCIGLVGCTAVLWARKCLSDKHQGVHT